MIKNLGNRIAVATTLLVIGASLLAVVRHNNRMNRGSNLSYAVSRSDMAAVQSMLDQGYDPNTDGYKGDKPIYWASLRGDSEMLTLLIRHGASVSGYQGQTALGIAVESGDVKTVKILLQNGVDPDKPGRSGKTARETAKVDSKVEILSLIIRYSKG